jgi:hypothetical protein
MNDRMLRELGELARQDDEADQARFDERWDRLAAGTLTAEEQAELEALAASSPESGEAYEAFRPLGADFQARMVAKARAELADAPEKEAVEPPVSVLPFRRIVRRVEVWLGGAAAVAASLFFLVHRPTPLAPLPVYSADPPEIQSEYRGVGSATAAPGSQVTLKVRPRTAVEGDLDLRSFLSCAGSELRPWPTQPLLEKSERGIVTLRGRLAKELRPGACEIWIVIARPGKLPEDLPTELRAGRTGSAAWQAVSTTLEIRLPA